MATSAENVVVAGTGDVYVADAGTEFATALPGVPADDSGWDKVGFISEEGATFSMDRETEELYAWQSMDAIRVLTTSEPKTISFELMQFDPITLPLALQGGTVTAGKYVPPIAGNTEVKAMLVYGIDGDYNFRFWFPRVQIEGAVEFNMNRSDAIRLPLEFKVLAAETSWFMESNHPAWATVSRKAPAPAAAKA